jgi:hypothetical protein
MNGLCLGACGQNSGGSSQKEVSMKHLHLQLWDTRSSHQAAELGLNHDIYYTGQKEGGVCLWSSRLAAVELSVTGACSHPSLDQRHVGDR